MIRFLISLILLFIFATTATSQLSGYGLIDGVYGFTLMLRESNDSFKEGTIVYDDMKSSNQIIATTRADTLRCQEIDDAITPLSTFILIRDGDNYTGEWYDEINKTVLPVILYPSKDDVDQKFFAVRYLKSTKKGDQKLFELALSPTVHIGKYLPRDESQVISFSSSTSFNTTSYYGPLGQIEFEHTNAESERISMESYRYKTANFTIEALIPDFAESFTDSLQTALVRWKENLESMNTPVSTHRFKSRYYAMCDLDYWSDDFISGSFEYVSPSGDGQGFTFIYERRNDRFISFDQLIRSGDMPPLKNNSAYLGHSFDLFGLIAKEKFNAIKNRGIDHTAWSDLDIRLKRKLNDHIR